MALVDIWAVYCARLCSSQQAAIVDAENVSFWVAFFSHMSQIKKPEYICNSTHRLRDFYFVIKCCRRPIFLLMAIYVQRLECLKSSNILLFFIACCHIGGGTGRFVFLAHKTNKLSFACALIFLSCQQPVWVQQLEYGVSNLRGNQNLGFQEQSHECSTTSSSLFSPSEMPL